jgi:hypothetical protein
MEEILPIAEVVIISKLAQTFLGQRPLLQAGKKTNQLQGEGPRSKLNLPRAIENWNLHGSTKQLVYKILKSKFSITHFASYISF